MRKFRITVTYAHKAKEKLTVHAVNADSALRMFQERKPWLVTSDCRINIKRTFF